MTRIDVESALHRAVQALKDEQKELMQQALGVLMYSIAHSAEKYEKRFGKIEAKQDRIEDRVGRLEEQLHKCQFELQRAFDREVSRSSEFSSNLLNALQEIQTIRARLKAFEEKAHD